MGSLIGRPHRTGRTFPGNTAVRRYLFHQRRHRTVRCRQSRGSPFPTGSVLFPGRVGIRSLLPFTWSVSPRGCMPAFPTGSVFLGRSVAISPWVRYRRHPAVTQGHRSARRRSRPATSRALWRLSHVRFPSVVPDRLLGEGYGESPRNHPMKMASMLVW